MYFSKVYFLKVIFWKCIFLSVFFKLYFPNFYFLKVYFSEVYFPKVNFPKVYFSKVYFLKVYFLKVYFLETFLNQSLPSPNFLKPSIPGEVRVFWAFASLLITHPLILKLHYLHLIKFISSRQCPKPCVGYDHWTITQNNLYFFLFLFISLFVCLLFVCCIDNEDEKKISFQSLGS